MVEEGDGWDQLSQVFGQLSVVVCPNCGEEADREALTCECCGASLDDESSLDILAGEARRGPRKVSMEESKNLQRLKKAHAALAAGKLDPEEFGAIIDEVLYVVESGLELYQSPAMKQQFASLEPEAAKVYAQLAQGAAEMQAGLYRMRSYLENENLAEVEAGLAQVEAGLWKVDSAQDRAARRIEE